MLSPEGLDRENYLAQVEALANIYDGQTILRAEVGSTAHGVTHATNDHDEIDVFVPYLWQIMNMGALETFQSDQTLIHRPGRLPADPSGPGDLDRTYHSLFKFVALLYKGNPSILFTLFAPRFLTGDPVSDALGDQLVAIRDRFRTKRTQDAYLGYARAQRERIAGTRGAAGRIRRSPEGGGAIDWKYAMHLVRLGIQGIEYLTTGYISTPSLQLDFLLSIRSGEVPLDRVLSAAESNEEVIANWEQTEPGITDWECTRLVAQLHHRAWAEWGITPVDDSEVASRS